MAHDVAASGEKLQDFTLENRLKEGREKLPDRTIPPKEPLVSVVIPIYNTQDYLPRCLESILDQTYSRIEVICVDDGSQDQSVAVAESYAMHDKRITVLKSEHKGPGRVRNIGIRRARGKYLLCIDSDDFVDISLLERAVARAEQTDADIVMWDIWYYNDAHDHRQYPPASILDFRAFDTDNAVFSWRDNPDYILWSFQNWCWNKLFKTSFIHSNNITFNEKLFRSEDIQFTCTALVKAQRMATVPERLTYYRIARANSAMATKHRHALDFLVAFIDFRNFLCDEGIFEMIERSYVNWAASSILYNLITLRDQNAFLEVFEHLKGDGMKEAGVLGYDVDYFFDPGLHDELALIEEEEPLDYLFRRYWIAEDMRSDAAAWLDFVTMDKQEEIDRLEMQIRQLNKNIRAEGDHLDAVTNSAEYRIGTILCRGPRAVQRKLHERKDKENKPHA